MDPSHPDAIRFAPPKQQFVASNVSEVQAGVKPELDFDLSNPWDDFTFSGLPPRGSGFSDQDFCLYSPKQA
jgi:hypothetical protein